MLQDVSELYQRAKIFLDLTLYQLPMGPDAPEGFRTFSENMDKQLRQSINEWEVPEEKTDEILKAILDKIRSLVKVDKAILQERIESDVNQLLEYLRNHYSIRY
ncbi:MAG: hypothetical protein A2252_04575 [Elusimicrobia bacterium RIFOXYA2_FULL_39_19]|nr:MAG: hypothetical protein A2252_04575 [Elusimicrobia bacterium RIFOXYA2_FULL_39_19]